MWRAVRWCGAFLVTSTCKKNLTAFNFLTFWVLWSVLPIPLDNILSSAQNYPLGIIVGLIVWAHTVWSHPKSFSVFCLIDSSSMKIGWFCSFSSLRSLHNYFLFMNVICSNKFMSSLAFNVLNLFNRVCAWLWQWDMYNCCLKMYLSYLTLVFKCIFGSKERRCKDQKAGN